MKQEVTGWQWHQLDHTQIICTLLQTDNDVSTAPLSFYSPSCCPTNSVKAFHSNVHNLVDWQKENKNVQQ